MNALTTTPTDQTEFHVLRTLDQHPVTCDSLTLAEVGYPKVPTPEQVHAAKLRALGKLIEEGRLRPIDPDVDPAEQVISDLDRMFPNWVDEANGLGRYVPVPVGICEKHPTGTALVWVYDWTAYDKAIGQVTGLGVQPSGSSTKRSVTVRAPGYTPEEIERKIIAHVELAVESDAPLGVTALLREIGGDKRATQESLRKLVDEGLIEKRKGAKPNSFELWPGAAVEDAEHEAEL